MTSSRNFTLFFRVSLFCCFDHFIGVFDGVGRSMLSCYFGVQGKDAFYLTPRRMIQVSILMMVSFKGNSRLYALGRKKWSHNIFLYILQFGMEIVQ